jgi:crotonobetainyl-CoA:carnitine CoA-transferase CaiB-like acyl-CoA transferase
MHGLRDLRVIDFSTGIAGAYCTKLLADARADVIKVEPPGGDPLRRWTVADVDLRGADGALFQFLNTSKRSLVGQPSDPAILELVAGADLVVESFEPAAFDAAGLCERFPGLVVLSITPFGRSGPYAGRPASEFTIQAECGSIGTRGLPTQPPLMAAGNTTFYVGGTFAAVAALAALLRARRTGQGEHVDFSLLEVMNVAANVYSDLMYSLSGHPPIKAPGRTVEIPSIEPTLDGWVGFNTNSRQQYTDFLVLIERPDLLEDQELATIAGRWRRMDEWNAAVRAWTTRHTTAEIVEKASLLRIPVAPVNDGQSVLQHPQFRARGVFVPNPGGDFLQPRPPYLVDGQGQGDSGTRPFEPAPRLGQHAGQIEPRARGGAPGLPPSRARDPELPLRGIRVLDATAWWAGPSACQMLATLGADVIHLEAIQRPDGMRMAGGAFLATAKEWWEWSGLFLAANLNKRGLTLNLADPRGLGLCRRLLAECDVFVENFSPRVIEAFGLDWKSVREINPRLSMVRMPAFGLDGPWRDNVGFAQTMEQMTGLAWLTGHAQDQPRIQRGPCDPLAGMHAAFAALVGLVEREASEQGHLFECTMVEGALNAAAEQHIEFTAYGNVMQRQGNRAPEAAPQGLYPCRGHATGGRERWLALSVASDAQWQALVGALGRPAWATEPALATRAGRRKAHDAIDAELARWAAGRELEAAVEELVALGIPAAPVFDGRLAPTHPQMAARGFFEIFEHPRAGRHTVATVPFRYATQRRGWIRSPAPTLGQHSREILGGILGLGADELDRLEAQGVIGTRPKGI